MPTRHSAGKARNDAAHATKERPEPYEGEEAAEGDDDYQGEVAEAYQGDDEAYEGDDEAYEGDDEAYEGELAEQASPPQRGGSVDGGAKRMSAAAAAEAGLRQIVELTGKHPEGVTSVGPTQAGWVVGVEIIEDRRIPSASDILAVYEAEVDMDGNLVSYRRTHRYSRGRGNESAG